jgi:hypothetical protein
MSAPATAPPLNAPTFQDPLASTVAVLLCGQKSDEASLANAAVIAAGCSARISILVLPRRVPLVAHCVAPFGYIPVSAFTPRAQALIDAATCASCAADFVPAAIPAQCVVITGSPIRAMGELIESTTVTHIVLHRNLLSRRPRLRRALYQWARDGMRLSVV